MFLNYMLLVIAEHSLWTEAEACHLNPHVTRPRAVLGPSVGCWVVGGGPCGHGSGDSAVPAWPGPAPAARQLSSGETAGSSTSWPGTVTRDTWHVTAAWDDMTSRADRRPQWCISHSFCWSAVCVQPPRQGSGARKQLASVTFNTFHSWATGLDNHFCQIVSTAELQDKAGKEKSCLYPTHSHPTKRTRSPRPQVRCCTVKMHKKIEFPRLLICPPVPSCRAGVVTSEYWGLDKLAPLPNRIRCGELALQQRARAQPVS